MNRVLLIAMTLLCLDGIAYAQQYVGGVAGSPQEITEAKKKFMAHLGETNKVILESSGRSEGRANYAAVGQFLYCVCRNDRSKMFYSYLIAQEYGLGFGPSNDALQRVSKLALERCGGCLDEPQEQWILPGIHRGLLQR